MTYKILLVDSNSRIDDYKSAASILDGVIIKCGKRTPTDGVLLRDPSMMTHYNGFYGKHGVDNNPIRIGFLWETNAITNDEIDEEIDFLFKITHNLLYQFPFFINAQYSNKERTGRADLLPVSLRTSLYEYFFDALAYEETVLHLPHEFYKEAVVAYDLRKAGYNLGEICYEDHQQSEFIVWEYTNSELIPGMDNARLAYVYKNIADWHGQVNIESFKTYIDEPVVYTGEKKICPICGIVGLTAFVDYDMLWHGNGGVGNAYVKFIGTNRYCGEKRLDFKILPADINDVHMCLERTEYEFNGREHKPRVVVEKTTQLGKACTISNYTVEYDYLKKPGKRTVTVTGQHNYTGSRELYYYIKGNAIFDDFEYPTIPQKVYDYNGSEICPKVTFDELKEGIDYEVEYYNNIEPGDAMIRVIGINQFEGEECGIEFTIQRRIITNEG